MSKRRVLAVYRKELREYRRNGNIVVGMTILPVIFLVQPLVVALVVPASASGQFAHEHLLLYMLAIPALIPAVLASYAVVGEREQGTLEPVLSTPIRSEEFLLGKALAAFVPAIGIAYAMYGIFLACVELFAHPGVAPALLHGPEILAQVLYTPLLAAWSIWLGLAISVRSSDVRVAGQLSALASLPTIAVTSLIAFNVIPLTFGVVFGCTALVLLLDALGGRLTAATFNRERLITG